ncbi:GNAT family N-acetyltransferase [uncultured Croceitalea sp.]|uniref:GNAT family N-acetyltransferase n=1 Tax=uncultured Croceitalea sp. TaxID=1798908 RepID=UPI003306416C
MLVYRNANKNDVESVAKLHAKSWQENYKDSFSQDFLTNKVYEDRIAVWTWRLENPQKNQSVILAEDSGQLVGFICVYFEHDKNYGTLLDNLHVNSKSKGKGIGTNLISRIVSDMKTKGLTTGLYLWVLDNNISAIKFYENLGGLMIEKVEGSDIGDKSFLKLRYFWDNIMPLSSKVASKKI